MPLTARYNSPLLPPARRSERARKLRYAPEMPDWPSRRDRLRGRQDRIGINSVVAVQFGDRSRLAEMLDTERTHTVAADRPEPGEGCRMAVKHGDQAAMSRQVGKHALYVGA